MVTRIYSFLNPYFTSHSQETFTQHHISLTTQMAETPSPSLSSVSGFTVLPLHIPPISSYPHPTTHLMYIRPHQPKLPDPRSQRSLYFTNVPIDSTLAHFRSLFSNQLGGYRVEQVEFGEAKPGNKTTKKAIGIRRGKKRKREHQREDEKPELDLPGTWDREIHASGSSTVCTFVDTKSAHGAMKAVTKAAKKKQKITWGGKDVDAKVPPLGSQRYQKHHHLQFPPQEILQDTANEFMIAFGEYEAATAKKLAKLRSEPDEDGFITVTRGGKEAPAKLSDAEERLKKQKQKDKEKADEMGNFYRFQIREKRKKEQQVHQRKVSLIDYRPLS